MEIERLITAREASKILCLAPKTIYQLALRGELACIRLTKRAVRFKPSDLQKFIEQHAQGGDIK